MKSIVWKELREQAKWLPIGLLVIGMVLGMFRPSDVADAVSYAFTMIKLTTPLFILLALALGLSQSISDSRPDARAHLLHRPISLQRIFAAKAIVGASLYLLATLLPLGVVAIWLASVGPEWIPVTGKQVVPALAMAMACFTCYMGATWMIYRPAKWYGTRLLPLAFTAAVPLVVFGLCNLSSTLAMLYLLITLVMALAISTAGALHAFVYLADFPPASSRHQRSRATILGTLIGSSFLFVLVGVALILWEERSVSWEGQVSLASVVDHSGKPYRMEFEYEWSQAQLESLQVPLALYDLRSRQPRHRMPVPKDWKPMPAVNLWASGPASASASLTSPHHYVSVLPTVSQPLEFVNDSWGRLLCYDSSSRRNLRYVITTAGVFDSSAAAGYDAGFSGWVGANQTLQAISVNDAMSPLLLADSQGVQRIDIANGTVERILNAPHESFAFVRNDARQVERFWARNGNVVSGYDLQAVDAKEATQIPDQPFVSLTFPDDGRWQGIEVSTFDDGYVVHSPWYQAPARFVSFDRNGTQVADELFSQIPEPSLRVEGNSMLAAIPPIVPVGIFAGEAVWVATQTTLTPHTLLWESDRATAWRIIAILSISTLLAMGLTFWLSGRRGLASGPRLAWTITAMWFSWSAALAVLALYPRVVRQQCGACGQSRRIDRDNCEHCGACWEPSGREGIEIFEAEQPPSRQQPVIDRAAIS